MNNISITAVSAQEAIEKSPSITALYKEVFAAPPWNEAYCCATCGKSFGVDQSVDTECCERNIEEYYPFEQTNKEIQQYFSYNRARIALALDTDATRRKLVGFSWGWNDTLEQANAEKFSLQPEQMEWLCSELGLKSADVLFYLSELGVQNEYRGNGIGKGLYTTVLEDRDDSCPILMRTSKKSAAFRIATKNEQYPLNVIYEYRDELDRVILASL